MSSVEQDDLIPNTSLGHKNPDRQLLLALLAGGFTAATGIGVAFLTHGWEVQSRECNRTWDRLVEISKSIVVEERIAALHDYINDSRTRECHYTEDAQQRLTEAIRQKQARTQSARPLPLPVKPEPPILSRPTKEPPLITAQQSPGPQPRTPPLNSIPVPPNGQTIPASQPLPDVPDLVVTRRPPEKDADTPFSGGTGTSLALVRNKTYELRPLQYHTTMYRITAGSIIVRVGGRPTFDCKVGNVFHLFWENEPDYFIQSRSRKATVKIVAVEEGRHLGVSTCVAPAIGIQ